MRYSDDMTSDTRTTTARTQRPSILTAAVVATLVGVGAAGAQIQVDTSNVADANTRVGSGGFNRPVSNPFDARLADDIVYGNVTGGRGFRDVVSPDPTEFRGVTAGGIVSDFVRDSSGISAFNANTTQRFLGEDRGVTPPAREFVELPGVGGYVPDRTPRFRAFNETRLGDVAPVATTDNSGFTAAQLRQFSGLPRGEVLAGDVGLQQEFSRPRALSPFTVLGNDLAPGVDRDRLGRLRDELSSERNRLRDDDLDADTLGRDMTTPQDRLQNDVLSGNEPNSDRLDDGVDPLDTQLQERPLQSDVGRPIDPEVDARIDGSLDTQYDALAERMRQRAERRAGVDGPDGPDGPDSEREPRPGEPALPRDDAEPQPPADEVPAAEEQQPPMIEDLGRGVRARGLQEIFDEAQTALDEGRYGDAADLYDTAERLEPGSGFATVGRAVADLGGGFYRLSAQELEAAFRADPTLLMGRYDFRQLLGDERLTRAVNDLKGIVQTNEQDPHPAFLLAAIQYNVGDEKLAAGYLDLAQRRAPDNGFYRQVRDAWNLDTE